MLKNITESLPPIKVFEGGTPITQLIDGREITTYQGGQSVSKSAARKLTLKYNGHICVVAPGECINVVQKFNCTQSDAPLIEARFMEKFVGLLQVVDADAEKRKHENVLRESKMKLVEEANTIKEVTIILKSETDPLVIDACNKRIDDIVSNNDNADPAGDANTEYEEMEYQDLLSLARERGLSVPGNIGKIRIIELLKANDKK